MNLVKRKIEVTASKSIQIGENMVVLIVLLGIIKGGKIPPKLITELNTYIIFDICLYLVTL